EGLGLAPADHAAGQVRVVLAGGRHPGAGRPRQGDGDQKAREGPRDGHGRREPRAARTGKRNPCRPGRGRVSSRLAATRPETARMTAEPVRQPPERHSNAVLAAFSVACLPYAALGLPVYVTLPEFYASYV